MAGPIDSATCVAVSPIALDALTVAGDAGWLDRVAAEVNLPAYLAPGLRALYGA